MEGPQDNRPLKKFKHLTIRARNCHGVSKDEQLRRLQLFLEVELAKKKLQSNYKCFFPFDFIQFFPRIKKFVCCFSFVCVSVFVVVLFPMFVCIC